MCYKVEKHNALNRKLADKLENIPTFISDFFEGYKSATTKNCNWGYIRDLLQWLIENGYIEKENITKITPEDLNNVRDIHIIKYLNSLKMGIGTRKNTIDSIRTKKNVFSSFWSYMKRNKYTDDNIITYIPSKLYKTEMTQKEIIIPDEEEVENFLNNLQNNSNGNEFDIARNIAIVKLIMGSGIRSEELINLDIEDLFLDEEEAYIMVLGKGKMEQYDKVYITESAKNCLEDYLLQRGKFVKKNNIQNNALFLSNNKKRISKTAITSFFKKYSDGKIYPHSLRHLVGTLLYQKTKDIMIVQRQLRHSSIETAARYYVSIDEKELANAMFNLW